MRYKKSEFELQKQILIDLGNLNGTLGLMNESKLFPSKDVSESVNKFFNDRKDFVNQKIGGKNVNK